MGIKNLNSYFRQKCTKESIKQKHLSFYRNKTIVIDTSIYLYRFNQEGELIENMYLLISILKHYNIYPIFVFDGRPPEEKKESLKIRKNEKVHAKARFEYLKNEIENELNTNILKDMKNEMEMLRKKIVTVKDAQVKNVQCLMDKYGVSYINANGEADVLCAMYTVSGKADYCLSDDTDMFLYNCPKVLRNISLINHCVLEYDTEKILHELNVSFNDFQDIMVLVGTDYNPYNNFNLSLIFEYYNEYKNQEELDFYDYLIKTKSLTIDKESMLNIKNIYNSCNNYDLNNIIIPQEKIDYCNLYNLMESNGFIFYNRLDNNLPWKFPIKASA
tara:strand:+ start:2172 stop:3164 length:993 start_codon:yes stop_codon:yes gene_type:complete